MARSVVLTTLAVSLITGCVVSSQGVPGETGPQGETGLQGEAGDSFWRAGDGYIYYSQDDSHGELARFSANYPQTFIGNNYTATIGGDATGQFARYISLGFGNPGEPRSTYGGIGVKVDTGGSTMVLGTSIDYGLGTTNEALSIDRNGNVDIRSNEVSIGILGNLPSFGSGQFHVHSVSNGGDAFSLETKRTDDAFPTRIRSDAVGNLFLEVAAHYTNQPGTKTLTPAVNIVPGGNIGINKLADAMSPYILDVNGDVNAEGLFIGGQPFCMTCSSDARLKKNIAPLPDALSRLLQLRGVTYEWREPGKRGRLPGVQTGLIAQEVEKVFPEWVGTDKDGFKTITIRGFEALTVESLRQLSTENESLRREVATLSTKADRAVKLEADLAAERAAREKLEARLTALEAKLAHPGR